MSDIESRANVFPAWWAHAPSLTRYVGDLLSAELALARPGRPPRPAPWPPELDFVRDLGADSLELLGLGTALVGALDLRAAEVDGRLLGRPCLGQWVEAARASLAADDARIGFRTSGSNGLPKRCGHALAALWQETTELARLVPGRRRVLSAVASHHIYGFLFTVLLPRLLGIEAVVDLRGASPAFALAQARAGDLIVAHPSWWEAFARLEPRLAGGVVGVSSGASCPDALAETLAACGLRLLQVYGSSETAGVGWRDRAGAPFTLLPYWRACADGKALARTPPEGSAAGTEARYALQDTLAWQGERTFLPAGRVDAAVQVGGVNVFPRYIADVLKMHPRVLDAAVRLMRADEGGRLKAFVVPRADAGLGEATPGLDDAAAAALRDELAAWLSARLAAPECPAAFTFGARLPRQASGKPADWIIDAV